MNVGGKILKLDDKIIESILTMFKDGMKKSEIANELNISMQVVRKYLRKFNIQENEHYMDPSEEAAIYDMYSKGESMRKIAIILGRDERTIKRKLQKKDVHIKTSGEQKRTYSINEDYFNVIDTPNKAYILGLIYADGYVNQQRGYFKITLQEKDVELLHLINKELCNERPLIYTEVKKDNHQNTYTLIANSMRIVDALVKCGAIQNKSLVLTYPQFLNKDLNRHFIRGYFDGDGCFYHRDHTKYFSIDIVGTEKFCTSVQEILKDNLCINTQIVIPHNKVDKTTRTLRTGGRNQVKKFLDWIYENSELYMDRKFSKYTNAYNI